MELQTKKPQHIVTTKMLLRVVFSFSIFSLLMFYCSSPVPLHVLRFCKFKLHSLQSDTNKNFMFLLCNGILCILFNSSGLIRQSMEPEADMNKNKQPQRGNVVVEKSEGMKNRPETEQEQRNHEDKEEEYREKVVVEKLEGMKNRPETEQEQRNHEGEEDHGRRRTCDRVVAHADEDETDDEETLSLEELNKKCDDFIRKMKLEIRFEDA